MSTLLVGYDLDAPGQNYAALEKKLQSYPNWWHHLDSTWIIKAPLTAVQLRDQLTPIIDGTDKLIVIDVSGDIAAWVGFAKDGSDWLKSQL